MVFEKHFAEKFVVCVESVTRDDDSDDITVPRQAKLAADAYTSLFSNTPSYLSAEPPRIRPNSSNARGQTAGLVCV